MADTVGQADIRGENIDRAVKGFALKEFKLKQVLTLTTSSAWTETYYRETAAELTANGETFSVQGVARLAAFPHVDPSWTKVQGTHVKFAAESRVSVEDKLTDAIDVQARTILRVARAIASAVDDYIYTQLTAATGTSGVVASADAWDSATIANRDAIGDILLGIAAMQENNYDVLSNGYLLLSPKDYSSLLRDTRVINNPSFKTADVVSNGVVGMIAGLKIIVSNSVTADEAMIVFGQRAATWRGAVPLTSAVIEDKGIAFTIRSWEIGHIQITDPQGLYTITNTQA